MSESGWEIGVMLFSGRRDPSWVPATDVVERIERAFDALPRLTDPVAEQPPLGYRGAYVRGPGVTVTACRGVATRADAGKKDVRADPLRKLEQLMVASAPAAIWSEPWAGVLRSEGLGP